MAIAVVVSSHDITINSIIYRYVGLQGYDTTTVHVVLMMIVQHQACRSKVIAMGMTLTELVFFLSVP